MKKTQMLYLTAIVAVMLCIVIIACIKVDKVGSERRPRSDDVLFAWYEQEESNSFPKQRIISLGEFTIYHYCACYFCCGKNDGITATETQAREGRTIAADWNILPPGTQVCINGSWYTVEDKGGSIEGKKIDVFIDGTHQDALNAGWYKVEVFILQEGT